MTTYNFWSDTNNLTNKKKKKKIELVHTSPSYGTIDFGKKKLFDWSYTIKILYKNEANLIPIF